MSPPTHHPACSHGAIQDGREAWIFPKVEPAPRSAVLLLALSCVVFKPSEDGDCTIWALWGPQLTCLHGKQTLYPDIEMQDAASEPQSILKIILVL